jgi:hypothetical protein
VHVTGAALYGSSLLPSTVWIGNYPEGMRGVHTVQLGEVVRRSFTDSGLTPEKWNGMDALVREAALAATVYLMRAEWETQRWWRI